MVDLPSKNGDVPQLCLIFPRGWGPQDSVQLPYFSGFMVDITIVNRAYNGL